MSRRNFLSIRGEDVAVFERRSNYISYQFCFVTSILLLFYGKSLWSSDTSVLEKRPK